MEILKGLWRRTCRLIAFPHRFIAAKLSSRWGGLSRRWRWPLAYFAPYRRRNLLLWRPEALGDVLMCTPTLRAIKKANPSCRITFFTKPTYTDLLLGLPFIDEVGTQPERVYEPIIFDYEASVPPHRHIARIFGDCVGIEVDDVRPSCAVDATKLEYWRGVWSGRPRPLSYAIARPVLTRRTRTGLHLIGPSS